MTSEENTVPDLLRLSGVGHSTMVDALPDREKYSFLISGDMVKTRGLILRTLYCYGQLFDEVGSVAHFCTAELRGLVNHPCPLEENFKDNYYFPRSMRAVESRNIPTHAQFKEELDDFLAEPIAHESKLLYFEIYEEDIGDEQVIGWISHILDCQKHLNLIVFVTIETLPTSLPKEIIDKFSNIALFRMPNNSKDELDKVSEALVPDTKKLFMMAYDDATTDGYLHFAREGPFFSNALIVAPGERVYGRKSKSNNHFVSVALEKLSCKHCGHYSIRRR